MKVPNNENALAIFKQESSLLTTLSQQFLFVTESDALNFGFGPEHLGEM
jgi:hypothetical protein